MANGAIFSMMDDYLKRLGSTTVAVDDLKPFVPFYSAIQVKMTRSSDIEVINGGTYMFDIPNHHMVKGRVNIRMGTPKKGSGANCLFYLPFDFKQDVAEVLLKRACDEGCWDAADDYIARVHEGAGTNKADNSFLKFSQEEPQCYYEKLHDAKPDMRSVKEMLEEATRILRKEGILSCESQFNLSEEIRYLASTEGTQIYTKDKIWGLSLTLFAVDDENRVLEHSHSMKGRASERLPTLDEILAKGVVLAEELSELKKAPIEKNGTYPAIMDFNNHGVIWHEVVGHSLEGHRMQDGEWGDQANLFADRSEELVGPDFITLVDDPTRADLLGHYKFDEEGVPAQSVTLIENGILKDFLHSRESAGYFGVKSNGHARAQESEIPVARMSNLIVKSSKEVSYDELKDLLMRECRHQNVRYGLIMEECDGGVTLPEDSMFNTHPVNVYRMYRNGKTERVRGIYIVGTPGQALLNMMATSDRYNTFNGFCGAESGFVATTITAPDLLLNCVEVNRIPNSSYDMLRNPVVPDRKVE